MRNSNLSNTENVLFELIQNVDAMTYEQIKQFLMKFMHCKENVHKYIIHNLIRMRAIEATQEDEEGYLLCGNSGYQTLANVNTDVVYAMYYLLDKAETMDDILSLMTTNMNNVALAFILKGKLYEATMVEHNEMYKVEMTRKRYENELLKPEYARDDSIVPFHSVFMFAVRTDEEEDEILGKIEEMNLEIPHSIVIFRGKNPITKPDYTEYAINGNEE